MFILSTERFHQINDDAQIMQFASDFITIFSGKTFNSTVKNSQSKLTYFNLLCKDLGFSFNQGNWLLMSAEVVKSCHYTGCAISTVDIETLNSFDVCEAIGLCRYIFGNVNSEQFEP